MDLQALIRSPEFMEFMRLWPIASAHGAENELDDTALDIRRLGEIIVGLEAAEGEPPTRDLNRIPHWIPSRQVTRSDLYADAKMAAILRQQRLMMERRPGESDSDV